MTSPPPDTDALHRAAHWLAEADGLLITGPVTQNMRLALRKTYEATPPPKLVIAVGACAINGGLPAQRNHFDVGDLLRRVYEVDPLVCPKCNGQMRIIAFTSRGE